MHGTVSGFLNGLKDGEDTNLSSPFFLLPAGFEKAGAGNRIGESKQAAERLNGADFVSRARPANPPNGPAAGQ